MIIQMPFYKYKIFVSQITKNNAFDWLYAKTCIYLNKVNNRPELDCSDNAKIDTRNEIENILGANIISKIESQLSPKFLEDSIKEEYCEDEIGSTGLFIYQDAVSGTVMPYKPQTEDQYTSDDEDIDDMDEKIYGILNCFDDTEIKITNTWDKVLQNTNPNDINNIKEALFEYDDYADTKILNALQIDIRYKDKEIIYKNVEIDVDNNEMFIISDFTENRDWNNCWLQTLKNSENKELTKVIDIISKKINQSVVDPLKTLVTTEKYPRNSKLNELFHLFKNLDNNTDLLKEVVEIDCSRRLITGFMTYCGKIMDRLSQRVQLSELNLEDKDKMIKEVCGQIRYIREHTNSLSCFKPREDQTEEDVVNSISKGIVSWNRDTNKAVFKKDGQWMYVRIALYAKNYYEVAKEMKYDDFVKDARLLYKKRNSEVHIEKEALAEELTMSSVIEKFYNVCKFLYYLIKKQNKGE